MLNKGSSFKSVIRDEDTPSSLEYFWLYLPWTKVRNESKVVRFHIATVFTISLWRNSFRFRVVFVLFFLLIKHWRKNIYSWNTTTINKHWNTLLENKQKINSLSHEANFNEYLKQVRLSKYTFNDWYTLLTRMSVVISKITSSHCSVSLPYESDSQRSRWKRLLKRDIKIISRFLKVTFSFVNVNYRIVWNTRSGLNLNR